MPLNCHKKVTITLLSFVYFAHNCILINIFSRLHLTQRYIVDNIGYPRYYLNEKKK